MSELKTLGPYQIIRRLARGGMAELFLARQSGIEGFEKTLVIKRLLPIFADDQDVVRMFLNEARVAARLTHPNVVQIYDLGRVDRQYYIAMEHIDGRDLWKVQKQLHDERKPFDCEMATYIVCCVCRALDYAHRMRDAEGRLLGLVHRDVSPQNVLISFNGDVKLTDFGIAKLTALAAETQAGVLKGKFSYMSPEQIRGERLDARSDIFSLGIVFYELLAGKRLFARDSEFATIQAVEKAPILPVSVTRDDVPPELEAVLMRALARDPDQRFASADEMQGDLDRLISSHKWHCGASTVRRWLKERVANEAPPVKSTGSLLDGGLRDSAGELVTRRELTPPSDPFSRPSPAEAKDDAGAPFGGDYAIVDDEMPTTIDMGSHFAGFEGSEALAQASELPTSEDPPPTADDPLPDAGDQTSTPRWSKKQIALDSRPV